MDSHTYQDKNVAVFGLGKSGMATAQRLKTGNAKVLVWDDNKERRAEAKKLGLKLKDLTKGKWSPTEALVLSPGVPLTHPTPHPVVGLAKDAGAQVIGDIEVFLREKEDGKLVGVTGTNGKSTTTALIHHLLEHAGKESALGGNIGTPVMDLPQLGEEGTYVLELSSYQLDLTPSWAADIAVLLNITPDHLDRHGDMAGYAAVKTRIFLRQSEAGTAIINMDDPICAAIAEEVSKHSRAKLVPVSVERAVDGGVFVVGGLLEDQSGDQPWTVDISGIMSLKGRHNWQNAAAAVAVVSCLGLSEEDIKAGLEAFGGLAHRMELVATRDKVLFVNDSKATNAEAAEKALTSYENIYWIAGGREKAGGITSLEPQFGRIKKAFLIGEAKDSFAETLEGKLDYEVHETLADATAAAGAAAMEDESDSVVLLSPAAASFDQFDSFEQRGDSFRNAVEDLIGEAK